MPLHRTSHRLALAVLAILISAYAIATSPSQPFTTPDSILYQNFSVTITAIYPVFLRLIPASLLVFAQTLLLLASAVWLAFELGRATHPLAAPLCLAAIALNPGMLGFARSILSEGLFEPLLCCFLALSIRYLRFPSPSCAAAIGALAGLCVSTRPIAYPLVLSFIVMALLARSLSLKAVRPALVLALAGAVGVIGAERIYSRALHGGELTTIAGKHLYAKAALLSLPDDASHAAPASSDPEDILRSGLTTDFEPIRALLNAHRDEIPYPVLESFYEGCLQLECIQSLRDKIPLSEARFNDIRFRLGLERILQAPLQFFQLTWQNYKDLWVLFPRGYPAFAPVVDAFIATNRPLPFEASIPPFLLTPRPASNLAYIVRPAFIGVGALTHLAFLASTILLFMPRATPGPATRIAGLAATAIVLVFTFNAFTGVGGPRYMMGMWPAIVLMLAAIAAPVFKTIGPDDGEAAPDA